MPSLTALGSHVCTLCISPLSPRYLVRTRVNVEHLDRFHRVITLSLYNRPTVNFIALEGGTQYKVRYSRTEIETELRIKTFEPKLKYSGAVPA